jgi:hypothetical protein
MNNKELLTLAAKAAGIADGDVFYDMENDKEWDPLKDDGDALRLAVKLNLMSSEHNLNLDRLIREEQFANTRDVAVRRAIVRAAAGIEMDSSNAKG